MDFGSEANRTTPSIGDFGGFFREEEIQCYLRLLNEPHPGDGLTVYCNTTWDGLSCWPTSAAESLISIPCFSTLNGVEYDISHNASRYCYKNGEWANKSDYSECKPLMKEDAILQVLWDVKEAATIYYVGYCLSLVALTFALWIFLYFRDLRCLRNTIHTNLMVTYLLIDLTWIITASLQSSTSGSANNAACNLVILLTYLMGTNFFWMFVEGLYLYMLVVKTFSVENIKIGFYLVIGWGLPGIVVILWAPTKSYFAAQVEDKSSSSECMWQARDLYDYIFICPIVLVLVVNMFFLGKIMFVLITKLRAANTAESKQYRKAAKALLVLIPLLGVTYIFVLVTPSQRAARVVFAYLQATLLSTQGFSVAVLYCFLNGEVRTSLRNHLERWKTERSLGRTHHHSMRFGTVRNGQLTPTQKRQSCVSMTTTTICINAHCSKCAGGGADHCSSCLRDEMV